MGGKSGIVGFFASKLKAVIVLVVGYLVAAVVFLYGSSNQD